MLFYFSGSQADYSAPSASGGCTGGDRIVRFASGRVRTVGAGSPSTHLCLRTHTKTIQAQKKKQSKVFKYSKLRKENFVFVLFSRISFVFLLRDLCLQWFTVLKRGPRADNTNKTVNMFSFGHRFGFLSSFMVLLFPVSGSDE